MYFTIVADPIVRLRDFVPFCNFDELYGMGHYLVMNKVVTADFDPDNPRRAVWEVILSLELPDKTFSCVVKDGVKVYKKIPPKSSGTGSSSKSSNDAPSQPKSKSTKPQNDITERPPTDDKKTKSSKNERKKSSDPEPKISKSASTKPQDRAPETSPPKVGKVEPVRQKAVKSISFLKKLKRKITLGPTREKKAVVEITEKPVNHATKRKPPVVEILSSDPDSSVSDFEINTPKRRKRVIYTPSDESSAEGSDDTVNLEEIAKKLFDIGAERERRLIAEHNLRPCAIDMGEKVNLNSLLSNRNEPAVDPVAPMDESQQPSLANYRIPKKVRFDVPEQTSVPTASTSVAPAPSKSEHNNSKKVRTANKKWKRNHSLNRNKAGVYRRKSGTKYRQSRRLGSTIQGVNDVEQKSLMEKRCREKYMSALELKEKALAEKEKSTTPPVDDGWETASDSESDKPTKK